MRSDPPGRPRTWQSNVSTIKHNGIHANTIFFFGTTDAERNATQKRTIGTKMLDFFPPSRFLKTRTFQ